MKLLTVSLAVAVAAGATFAAAQTQNHDAGAPSSPKSAKSSSHAKPASTASTSAQGQGGVQQCVSCHGEHGEGNPKGGYPRLAGQSQDYLVHQLESFANGTRRNAVMQPIAKGLSREARTAAAAYYARQTPSAQDATTGSANAGAVNARGEVLATVGDDSKHVQGCRNCHGPGGTGEPPEIPYLAGLDAKYIASALNAFKNGSRHNDPGAQMRAIARGLSADDIAAVSQYFASLSPPAKPAPENIVRAPARSGTTTGAGTPRRATTTRQSDQPAGQVGSEQGAGTTGGSQGAGGADEASTQKKGGR